VSVFWVLLGIVVLGGVAVVAAGRGEGLSDTQPDRADLTLPADRPAAREDVDQLRFSVGLRGYRMDEVDDVLDRLALDIALRDGLIGELREQLADRSASAGAPPTPEPGPGPTERAAVVQGAAMVGPVEVAVDPATTRTLLVPLEQYGQPVHEHAHAGADTDHTDRNDGADGADGEPTPDGEQGQDRARD